MSSAASPQAIKVCVFCGASSGKNDAHLQAARELAKAFHDNNIHLVYGGGTHGVMGELAKTLVSLSGPDSVHGIIPSALLGFERKNKEDDGARVEELIDKSRYGRTTVVDSMHTRKQLFAAEVGSGLPGSGFVAMSGGFGTLEELLEVTTWNQLGIHAKPVVVFNINGMYDGLFNMIERIVDEGFITEKNKDVLAEARTAEQVIEKLQTYKLSTDRFQANWEIKKT